MNPFDLTPGDQARYAWQMATADVGEAGQRKLKAATVLVSRCGGVGGMIAQQLTVAGVGRLILAHGGNLKAADLNRQILMRDDAVGRPRIEILTRRLRELNPSIDIQAVAHNISDENAADLIKDADVVACAAPLFQERFAMNAACVQFQKPLVHAAMHDFDFQVGFFHPPHTGCLQCVCPAVPAWWTRQFPVFGAVSAVAGALAAAEIIKWIVGIGEPLCGGMLVGDLRLLQFRNVNLPQDPACKVCGSSADVACKIN